MRSMKCIHFWLVHFWNVIFAARQQSLRQNFMTASSTILLPAWFTYFSLFLLLSVKGYLRRNHFYFWSSAFSLHWDQRIPEMILNIINGNDGSSSHFKPYLCVASRSLGILFNWNSRNHLHIVHLSYSASQFFFPYSGM